VEPGSAVAHLGDDSGSGLAKLARVCVGTCNETDPSNESRLRKRRGIHVCQTSGDSIRLTQALARKGVTPMN